MDEFIRRSKLTGEHYDVYKCVRIVNIQQVSAYLDNDANVATNAFYPKGVLYRDLHRPSYSSLRLFC